MHFEGFVGRPLLDLVNMLELEGTPCRVIHEEFPIYTADYKPSRVTIWAKENIITNAYYG